ncbi:hypothetical protein BDN72DRAFT_906154 [Pluteus cervinus]|uniref:Uncharacterized protein n=1 Tax=Pluteus cervinus TaxID=181527 RepID=A0ACD3A0L1_9AGAR|nr:hypothetical protein BDN72DRAFT_906154 [Pluteus cervinus]
MSAPQAYINHHLQGPPPPYTAGSYPSYPPPPYQPSDEAPTAPRNNSAARLWAYISIWLQYLAALLNALGFPVVTLPNNSSSAGPIVFIFGLVVSIIVTTVALVKYRHQLFALNPTTDGNLSSRFMRDDA